MLQRRSDFFGLTQKGIVSFQTLCDTSSEINQYHGPEGVRHKIKNVHHIFINIWCTNISQKLWMVRSLKLSNQDHGQYWDGWTIGPFPSVLLSLLNSYKTPIGINLHSYLSEIKHTKLFTDQANKWGPTLMYWIGTWRWQYGTKLRDRSVITHPTQNTRRSCRPK